MPFNGSGTFVPLPAPDYPAVTGTTISSTAFNNYTVDLMSNGLSKTLVRDGQAAMTGNLNFGGFRGTNLAAPVASTDAATLGTLGNYLLKASNLSDLANLATARTNLGVTATGADTTYAFRANNLSDLTSPATALANIGGAPLNAPDFTGQVEIQSGIADPTPALIVRSNSANSGRIRLGNNVDFVGGDDLLGWSINYGGGTNNGLTWTNAVGLRVQKGSTNGGTVRLGDNCDLQGGNDYSPNGFQIQINGSTVLALNSTGNLVAATFTPSNPSASRAAFGIGTRALGNSFVQAIGADPTSSPGDIVFEY